jgi:hypothetical protein
METVQVQILFTRSNLIGSRLIRYVLKEPVSHVAIRFPKGNILDSTAQGKRVSSYKDFTRRNEIVFSLTLELTSKQLVSICWSKWNYDWGAFLYLGVRALLPFLPKKNLWQTTGMYLCSELVANIVKGTELSHLTPYQLYLLLQKEKGK